MSADRIKNHLSWIVEELGDADFGDLRLTKRCQRLLDAFAAQPNASIPVACGGWAETQAAYRFFQNENVVAVDILRPHKEATLKRMAKEAVILLCQDTSELDYSTKQNKIKGLGVLNWETRRGLHVHPLLAVTPQRLSLGIVETQMWSRPLEDFGKKKDRKQKPIEEKESFRWIQGYRQACELSEHLPDTQVIMVADRECDIYELFTTAEQQEGKKAEWLIRAEHNRSLFQDTGKKGQPLDHVWEHVGSGQPLGLIEFKLPTRDGLPERTVEQTLYACSVKLRPPQRKGRRLSPVTLTAVFACEKNLPDGVEPIQWRLLTSIPVEDFECAAQLIQWYLCRWEIEIFFRILKSGCRVEHLQLEHTAHLMPCIALYMIVAWRILFLTMLGRTCPELSCDVVFEDFEWKVAYAVATQQAPPDKPPCVCQMLTLIAGFGGYLGRTRDPPPGPTAIWIGLQRTRDFAIACSATAQIKEPII